ncbi:MAG: hypothetical protein HZB33_08735 [Nitrospirae bacterium]|nr:hypothetical protein [Nitrospirota bacterium]
MIKEIRNDFLRGIERLKWFSRILSFRLKIEIAIIKLMYRSHDMGRKKDDKLIVIGRRVYELRETPDKNVMKDRVVTESISEIEMLEKEILDLNHKISELSGAGL